MNAITRRWAAWPWSICLGLSLLFVEGAHAQMASTATLGGASANKPAAETLTPSDADMSCAGFFSKKQIDQSIYLIDGPDGGFKNEYGTGDIVYLSKGTAAISAPGGEYSLLRPINYMQTAQVEFFPGQTLLISNMGTMYQEVGRIKVDMVEKTSSAAEVVSACEPIEPGDIAIPFIPRTAPPYKADKITDIFAPSSGKPGGVIFASKDFDVSVGENSIVYLNVGKKKGAQVGSYLRVYRSYISQDDDIFLQATRKEPAYFGTVHPAPRLKYGERSGVPRNVLGEIMLLSVDDDSSTGIVTFSHEEFYLGDQVEIE